MPDTTSNLSTKTNPYTDSCSLEALSRDFADMTEQTFDHIHSLAEDARDVIRQRPVEAVLLGISIGFLVGLIFKRLR